KCQPRELAVGVIRRIIEGDAGHNPKLQKLGRLPKARCQQWRLAVTRLSWSAKYYKMPDHSLCPEQFLRTKAGRQSSLAWNILSCLFPGDLSAFLAGFR